MVSPHGFEPGAAPQSLRVPPDWVCPQKWSHLQVPRCRYDWPLRGGEFRAANVAEGSAAIAESRRSSRLIGPDEVTRRSDGVGHQPPPRSPAMSAAGNLGSSAQSQPSVTADCLRLISDTRVRLSNGGSLAVSRQSQPQLQLQTAKRLFSSSSPTPLPFRGPCCLDRRRHPSRRDSRWCRAQRSSASSLAKPHCGCLRRQLP